VFYFPQNMPMALRGWLEVNRQASKETAQQVGRKKEEDDA
jgi:hypothetical protein